MDGSAGGTFLGQARTARSALWRWAAGAVLAAASLVAVSPAWAQGFSNCQAISQRLPGSMVVPVSTTASATGGAYDVTISYVGHATFRITAPDGTSIATDYTGHAGAGGTPTVVTMNHAHSSHFTHTPDPGIAHVLRGWETGGQADHHLEVGEVIVRNVPTDIRRWGNVEESGNSIFIFEIAGLCIGHLGHLHQLPSDQQYAEIGRLDVVFVPIDGTYTMDQPAMMQVVSRLRSSIVIPMHWWSDFTLTDFVTKTRADGFAVEMRNDPTITVSLNTLPEMPTLIVLPRQIGF